MSDDVYLDTRATIKKDIRPHRANKSSGLVRGGRAKSLNTKYRWVLLEKS